MKVVAITGGGQGIGRGIALQFARAGYSVSIADPVEDGGREAVDLIEKEGAKALYEMADTSNEEDVARWMERTARELGAPCALVNNAGIMIRKPFLELTAAELDRVLAVHVRGAVLCAQTAARLMINDGIAGSIINIASTRAFMSEPDTEAYTAAKGALVALTHAMAMSLGKHRIRVNSISPGWIETRDWQFSERSRTPEHSKEDREQHPVGRIGTPDDIAEACLFLSEHAGFMTGQNIIIDGGMSVKMIYE